MAASALIAAATLLPAQALALDVSVSGLKSTAGDIYVCVWRRTDQGFPNCAKGKPFKKVRASADAETISVPDLAAGAYAVTMYHDPLRQGRPKTNFFGMPTSAIGIANNPSVSMTNRPTFDKARVDVPATQRIDISAKYLF
ncbi:MAG: DUF2141 domain-containing protein [Pseudomonadota bacterium]